MDGAVRSELLGWMAVALVAIVVLLARRAIEGRRVD